MARPAGAKQEMTGSALFLARAAVVQQHQRGGGLQPEQRGAWMPR